MGIRSLEELKKIRENSRSLTGLRSSGGHSDGSEPIEILVGMATCGIASGARETMNELTRQLSDKNIDNIRVIPVGCIGFCKDEPVIQVNIPEQKPVVYGNVKKERVAEIIDSHIINKNPVERMVIGADFIRA